MSPPHSEHRNISIQPSELARYQRFIPHSLQAGVSKDPGSKTRTVHPSISLSVTFAAAVRALAAAARALCFSGLTMQHLRTPSPRGWSRGGIQPPDMERRDLDRLDPGNRGGNSQ